VAKDKRPVIYFNSQIPQFAWLSAFAPFSFIAPWNGGFMLFRSREHYYQMHKTKDKNFRAKIANASDGGQAKYWGSAKSGCPIVEDFDSKREKIMRRAMRYQYAQNPMLVRLLRDTENAKLVEQAPWDDYFGNGRDGKGKNVHGKLHEEYRDNPMTKEELVKYRPDVRLSDLSYYPFIKGKIE
jgi:Uncharacterized protein conserved in bacteria